jgi:hypothetical protein
VEFETPPGEDLDLEHGVGTSRLRPEILLGAQKSYPWSSARSRRRQMKMEVEDHAGRRRRRDPDVIACVSRAPHPGGSAPAADPHDGGQDPGSVVAALRLAVFEGRATVDPAGAAAAGLVAAGAVHHPQRADVDGTAGLQDAVPLVCGPGDGRSDLGPDGVHQELPTAVGRPDRPVLHPRNAGPGEGAGPVG